MMMSVVIAERADRDAQMGPVGGASHWTDIQCPALLHPTPLLIGLPVDSV